MQSSSLDLASLQRVAAFYDLDLEELCAVAAGRVPLVDAAAKRLAKLQRPAEELGASADAEPAIATAEMAPASEPAADTDLQPDMEAAIESAAASLLKEMSGEREHELVEEVQRAQAAPPLDALSDLREKSDAIFGRFDADGDGILCLEELNALSAATGGQPLTELAFRAVCAEVKTASAGISREALWLLYTDAGMGDAKRDYNLVFPGKESPGAAPSPRRPKPSRDARRHRENGRTR